MERDIYKHTRFCTPPYNVSDQKPTEPISYDLQSSAAEKLQQQCCMFLARGLSVMYE